jgi:hypothetical protein
MSDYPLDQLGRYALLTIHKQKCWLCYEPVSLPDMEADHMVPESLATEKSKLEEAFYNFGLPSNFDLHSLCNLLPSHHRCNKQKLQHVFRPTPLIQYWLDQAASKAQDVRDLRQKLMSDRALEKAIATIESRQDELTPEQIRRVALPYASANSSPMMTGTINENIDDGYMSYSDDKSALRYVPPRRFLVTPSTSVIFDQEPREIPDADFHYIVEKKSTS